tara:strand:+ start:698 stop:898 length:201 start_codon:yes stop_codon:yes gene_type:complete
MMADSRRSIPVREELAQRVKIAAVIANTSMFAIMNDLIEKHIPEYDLVGRTPDGDNEPLDVTDKPF